MNHNSIMHRPSFSSFTAVSRVQSMYIKQVLVDLKITMSHPCKEKKKTQQAIVSTSPTHMRENVLKKKKRKSRSDLTG